MSGLEIILALVPVVITASITAYKELEPRVNTFRDYADILHRTRANLDTNRTRFDSESRRLLQFAFSDRTIQRMKADPDGKTWKNSSSYERRLRRGLGTSYDTCMGLVDSIGRELGDYSEKLDTCVGVDGPSWKLRFRLSRVAPALEEINGRLGGLLGVLGDLLLSMEASRCLRRLRPMYVFVAERFVEAGHCLSIGKGVIDGGSEK